MWALLLALLVTAPHAARGDLNFVIGCLAERGCPGAQFANYGGAALNQAGAGTVTVAHFLSGAIGKWSTQEVYEAYLGYVLKSLPAHHHDVFLCVSKNESDTHLRPRESWQAAFDGLGIVAASLAENSHHALLRRCLRHAEAVEASAGRLYNFVLSARADLVWTAPVAEQVFVVAEQAVQYAAGAAALCPRAAVSEQWACKPPPSDDVTVVGPDHFPAVSVLGAAFQFERPSAPPPAFIPSPADTDGDYFPSYAGPVTAEPASAAPAAASASSRAAAAQRVALVLIGRCKQTMYSYSMFFESYRARVVDTYRAAGHDVTVFFCADLNASVPAEDAGGRLALRRLQPYTVYEVEAKSQFERMDRCYSAIKAAHPSGFDWYFRSRPDLMLWDDAPPLEQLDPGAIHARILSAQNVSGLTYANFASEEESCWPDVCTPGECNPPGAPCALYDDQLAIVPRAMADAYWLEVAHVEGATPNGRECEWVTGGFPEHFFQRNTMRKGGRFAPLALEARLVGYKGEMQLAANEGRPKPCPAWFPPPAPPPQRR